MQLVAHKRVLVAPLDWGLGHATRCVPVIRELQRQGAEVILAADGKPFHFLEKTFPQLPVVRLPGYNISYPKHSWLGLHLAMRSPGIARRIRRERRAVEKLAREYQLDAIISDNRLAARSEHTINIFITHQLRVRSALGEKIPTRLHKRYYEKFDEVWVPDAEGKKNLSGALGHDTDTEVPVRYIGPLSRFRQAELLNNRPKKWWLVVLLSGPEPQRTIFEKIVLEELAKFTEDTLVVRGLPENDDKLTHPYPHVTMVNHLHDIDLQEEILSTHYLLCRPGYSTICDLATLNVSPIVVPTPGQSEQEYLAFYHASENHVVTRPQKNFNLGEAIRMFHAVNPFGVFPEPRLLERRVRDLMKR